MATISRNDLDRIVFSVSSQRSTGTAHVPRKERLKELSDARVAGWTDTLAAKRKARLDWKAEKARQDEDQRQVQDAKDAARRQNARKETLEAADKLMWEKTEKFRRFRSQQMLVDTLETRDEQLKEKEEKRKKENAMEELWHMAVMENMRKAEEKSKSKIEKEKERSMKLAEDLRRQRDERDARMTLQQQRRLEEEKVLVEKIAADNVAAEQTVLRKKDECRINAKEAKEKHEVRLKQQQEESRRKELELTRKCEEEVAQRNRTNAARAELEIKHFEENQSRRKMLSDGAADELKRRIMRECEIFERDVRLRNQQAREKTSAAQRKLEQERAAIDASRERQLASQRRQKEAERQLGELYAQELSRASAQEREAEQEKELARRRRNVELHQMQQRQARENEKRRAKEKAEALKEEQQVFHKLQKKDDVFMDFVKKEIENFKARGKKTALLEKTLES